MKTFKLLKNIGLVLFLGLIAVACSSDDNKGGGSDHFKDVPKGEIVSVEQRFITLTGYEENTVAVNSVSTLNADTQKWWKYIYGKIEYNCEGENESEEIDEAGFYYAFFPNGKLYYKDGVDGVPVAYNNWEWTDSSKSKVRITDNYDGESMVFEFTELNSNTVVYASYQSEGGCSLLTWEKLGIK